MTTQPTTPDERGGHTSASNAEADSLCQGRFLAQRGLPEPPATDYSDSGEVIHCLYTDSEKPSREPMPDEIDKADELRNRENEVAALAGFGPECMRLVEKRLWHDIGDDPIVADCKHSGRFDVCLYDVPKRRALILDAKSGWLPVPPPNTNLQLRDLAALFWAEFQPTEILVNILKPFGRQDASCLYLEGDLEESLRQMEERVRRSNDTQAKRTPGEAQCRYCRAAYWGRCKVHSDWLASCLPVLAPPLRMVSAAEWTPEQRAVFCERMGTAAKWLEARKDEIKALLKADPASVPGFGLRDGRKLETIINPQAVFERFVLSGGNTEAFLRAVKVGKTALKDEVREVSGKKGKALDTELARMIEGCTETRQSDPQIAAFVLEPQNSEVSSGAKTPDMNMDTNTQTEPAPPVRSTDGLGQWDCKTPGFDSVEVIEIKDAYVRFRTRWGTVTRSRRGFMKNYRPNVGNEPRPTKDHE